MAKILIIDDEKVVRETLKLIVAGAGHAAHCTNDGREGMKALAEIDPDLVITDILMPEQEGIETIAEVRKYHPDLPIIAISGGGRVGNMDFLTMAERFGATRTLAKPFSPVVLLGIIGELLPKAA